MRTVLLAFAIVAACPPAGIAGDTPDDFRGCDSLCIADQQKRLEALWSEVHAMTYGDVAKGLEAERRAWEAYRDASCSFMNDASVSSDSQSPSFDRCRARVVADRLRMIEAHMRFVDN